MIFKTKTRINFFDFSKITATYFIFLVAVIFLLPIFSLAQVDLSQTQGVAASAGLGTADGKVVIGNVIKIALGFLGLIGLVIVLIAGFKWMTSAGNEEKIKSAKKMLMAGLTGMLIILFSYVIVNFIINKVQEGGNNPGGSNQDQNNDYLGGFGAGALGGGVIEYHYPVRDANNIARNTMIMITFKVPVATSSVVDINSDLSGMGEELCGVYGVGGAVCGKLSDKITIRDNGTLKPNSNFIAVLSADGKNILIDPIEHLGNPQNNTNAVVHLTGDMKNALGQDMFAGLENGYSWTFEVSTFLDVTPPKVNFVWPKDDTVHRNAIVQINFSEPINIMSISSNTVNLKIGGVAVLGTLRISNGYKTVEFLSSTSCGEQTRNSCGEQVFCLPGNSFFEGSAKSSTGANLLLGINDASGNFLDGNSDGAPGDNFSWSFDTDDELDLTAPRVLSITPSNDSENNNIKTDVSATFNEIISPSSLSSNNFYIYKFDANTPPCNNNAPGGKKTDITEISCFPNYTVFTNNGNKTTNIEIYSPFLQASSTVYRPRLTSNIKDSYGNCFYDALGIGRESKTQLQQQ